MSDISFSVTWDEHLMEQIPEEANQGARDAAEEVLAAANRDAPYLTGALVRSSEVITDPPGYRWQIVYRVPYAARQHWTNARHRRWLARATEDQAGAIERAIAARTHQAH